MRDLPGSTTRLRRQFATDTVTNTLDRRVATKAAGDIVAFNIRTCRAYDELRQEIVALNEVTDGGSQRRCVVSDRQIRRCRTNLPKVKRDAIDNVRDGIARSLDT